MIDTARRTMEEIAADPAMRFLEVTSRAGGKQLFAIRSLGEMTAESRMMVFEGLAVSRGETSRRLTGAEWLVAERSFQEALLRSERMERAHEAR